MSLDSRDLSILTQVAFKAAVDSAGVSLRFDEDGNVVVDADGFNAVFAFYRTSLQAAVTEATGSVAKPAPRPAGEGTRPTYGEDAVREAFPNTTEVSNTDDGGFELKAAKGEQKGPFPAWLIADCMEMGITEVWDNRPQQGNRPIFKESLPKGARGHGKDGDAKAWWPKD